VAAVAITDLRQHLGYLKPSDIGRIEEAYQFSDAAHQGQFRLSGHPYISHPLAVAEIVADWQLDTQAVMAALLHDVMEDTKISKQQITERFGKPVAELVDGLSKLDKIEFQSQADAQAENFRKMLLAMARDVRVILIKLADRLHNMRTLDAVRPQTRKRVARETLEIYAPIANRLGMNEMRTRIEDLAFRYAMPKEYEWVSKLAEKAATAKEGYIERVKAAVAEDLRKAGVPFVEIQGRVKHLFSLYQKLLKHERDIVQIHDLIALRVLLKDVAGCYAALGIIHQRWKPLSGRIKDYIAQPKPNGYKSLHTTVFCDDGEIVEFQIRTVEMHEEAERGIAAHWRYDEDGKQATAAMAEQLSWVKDLAETQREIHDKQAYLESLETLKIDVFQNRIFVFTPKGDVIDLPEGATPVDFAYAIHSHIGATCVGARVNDVIVSLDSVLNSGDFCEIIVDKNRKSPNPDWLTFVKTSHARSHIRAMTKSKLNKWLKDISDAEDEAQKKVPSPPPAKGGQKGQKKRPQQKPS
jgi:guanosine-3',5'-bis(diphosphate) 3'-pyrophosphohydrolase